MLENERGHQGRVAVVYSLVAKVIFRCLRSGHNIIKQCAFAHVILQIDFTLVATFMVNSQMNTHCLIMLWEVVVCAHIRHLH
jgi:hypothetical protein